MPNLPKPYAPPGKRIASTDRWLPAAGCQRPAPPWPSGHRPTEAEAALWSRLWALPQAEAWHDLALAETVERYARVSAACAADLDAGAPKAALLAVERGLCADLGLSAAGLARLRWKVGEPAPAPATARLARRTLKAIDPPPAAP